MTAVAAATPPVGTPGAGSALSRATRLYIFAVAATAVAAGVPSLLALDPRAGEWLAFVVLAAGAAASSFFVVPTGRNHGFHLAIVFVVAATLLLPPGLVVLVPVAQHLPDVFKRRYPWYIQTFNIANYAIDAWAAWAVVHATRGVLGASTNVDLAVAGSLACLVYVLLNHLLLAVVLRLARGHRLRDSGLFSVHSLWIDVGLAGLGLALAAFWLSNPYLIATILAPLILVQRSLSVLALLRESEARFRAIFESTAMGSRVTDLRGAILESNRSYEELLGYAKEELVERRQSSLIHPDDRERNDELFAEMVAGGRESYQLEQRFLRKDGEAVWAQLTSSLVRDPDGNPQFSIGMVQDMTQRKQLEEQLRHSQKMDAIGRLAGGVAHDFNNLLTVIQTYASFAAERARAAGLELREDLDEIQKAAQRAAGLTRQLLAFSRRQVLQPQVLDLNAVIADTNGMLSRLIGGNIALVPDLDPTLGPVKADPDGLAQVLVNLVVNARDAMPDGGTLTIETTNVELTAPEVHGGGEVASGRYVSLAVRDTGCGIDEETLSRIFEPFFTTKEKGKGTGLGLSTVYGIVAQSGGTIAVASELGAGTTFTVRLPQVDEPVVAAADGAGTAGVARGGETVLVVEDEDAVRAALRRMLRGRGYEVIESFDANEALQIAERHRGTIELLVTDIAMPIMRGTQLVERLAPLLPGLKVLFVSGYPDEDDVSGLLAGQGVDLLEKPFNEEELAQKVRALLDGRAREPLGAA